MLLTRLARAREDAGSALVSVIALVLTLSFITAALLGVTLSATAFTTSARAASQSKAAAQAGLDVTRLALNSGSCTASGAVTAVGATGTYQVSVYVPSGGGWALGCPSDSGTQLRLVSVGTAAGKGTGGATTGDTTTIAAVLAPGVLTLPATGPAVYSYTANSLSGGASILPYNGSTPDVMVKSGDVSCSGGSLNNVSDLVVANGALTMSGSCAVAGNVSATGALNVSGGASVGGDAVASSIISSSAIGGGAWATGGISLSGGSARVGGNVSAAGAGLTGGAAIAGNAWITGATTLSSSTIGGNLTTKTLSKSSSTVSGTTTVTSPAAPGASPYVAPTAPAVPNWFDYTYSAANWAGYTLVTLSSAGACGNAQLTAALATIGGNPGLIDARGCAGGVDPGSYQILTLANNVAIFANSFNLAGSAGFTAATPVTLWLITPDTTPNGVPTCVAGSSFTLAGGFLFSSTVSTMIYTPCTMNLTSGNTVYGQIWAGQVVTSGAGVLDFVPIGIPGYDLSTGSAVVTTKLRTVISQTIVNGG